MDCRGHSKGKSDFHYIVSVNQEEGEVRCIVCRGSKYPPTLPRPLPTSLPLLPPLIDSSSERGALEQQASALAIQTRFRFSDECSFLNVVLSGFWLQCLGQRRGRIVHKPCEVRRSQP